MSNFLAIFLTSQSLYFLLLVNTYSIKDSFVVHSFCQTLFTNFSPDTCIKMPYNIRIHNSLVVTIDSLKISRKQKWQAHQQSQLRKDHSEQTYKNIVPSMLNIGKPKHLVLNKNIVTFPFGFVYHHICEKIEIIKHMNQCL